MSLRDTLTANPGASLLLTDLYQLNMIQAYLDAGMTETAVFEFFIRKLPADRSFFLAAGLEQTVGFLERARFTEDELAWLKQSGRFRSNMLDYLADFRFTGDVHAMAEGTAFFPDEPILRVTAPLPEAQLLETRLINLLQYQTLVASKAARMVLAAPDMLLADFGLRRAHSAEAGLLAARACYLAGFAASATVPAEPIYGVPIIGTMAHSFVQAHHDETSAFLDFARSRPDNVVLLIDTYDVEKGTQKAISVAPVLQREGIKLAGVRIDSGDLAAHAVRVRAMLDEAGLTDTRIFVSGGLDEWKLRAFTDAGAPIDGAGIGTSLTTSEDAPAFDCAYKLQEYAGAPKRKQSEKKATWPGRKQVFRRRDAAGAMTGDLIALADETAEGEPLVEPVMRGGARLGDPVDLEAARARAREELARLPEHLQALETQPPYPVEISSGLQRVAEQVDAEIARERDKTPGPVEG